MRAARRPATFRLRAVALFAAVRASATQDYGAKRGGPVQCRLPATTRLAMKNVP